MRISRVILTTAIILLTAGSAFALTNYNSAYPTVNSYNYRNTGAVYSQRATMYGYGTGYTFSDSRFVSGYSPVDGYRLTSYGPYPYPPNAQFVSDPQFIGHYDAWSGQYYDAWSGRPVSQYPRQSGGIPAYQYPRSPFTVNRYSYQRYY